MSAIWGKVVWDTTLHNAIEEEMSGCYKNKYKIDRFSSVLDNHYYMGCGIQYISPMAECERIPIKDEENGFIFTADIVLDNRRELLSDLGITEKCSDGEIAYQAYLRWGIDCVKKFYGLFALAIWDYKNQKLVLANDHISARCLYYQYSEEGVIFSTLLEPILSQNTEIEINELYLKDFLAAPKMLPTVVVEETPYKDIFKLPAASVVTITKKDKKIYRYWTPADEAKEYANSSVEEYGKAFRELLTKCVADAIYCNGQIGIALSSGLDSSSIGTIAADLLKQENKNLYAYTYVPSDTVDKNTKNKIYDETDDVKKIVAMHDNMVPHFLKNGGKHAISSIEEGLDTLEMPYKAFVNYPSLREIYREAEKENCKVVLSGQFGNSTISYGNVDPIFFDLYVNKRFITLLKAMNGFARHMKISRRKYFQGYLKYLHRQKQAAKKSRVKFELDFPFASSDFIETYPLEERFHRGRMDLFSDRINTQKEYQELLTVFPGSTYIGEWETKLGLKYGMILRDPTKDRRIIGFCYQLPYEYFAYGGTTKWLIRNNMRDMLPDYILDNWDRHGIQNHDWLRRIEADWSQIKLNYEEAISNKDIEKYVDVEKVKNMMNKEGVSISSLEPSTAQYIFFVYIVASYVKNRC